MTRKLFFLLFAMACSSNYAQDNFLDCDGTNDYVDVPNSGNLLAGATNISMSCKVFPKRVTSGFPDFNGVAGYRNESNMDFYLIQLSSTDLEARFRNANGQAYTITYTGLTLNQWNHFFLVYNGTTLKLYKGTTEVGSVPASGTVTASNTSTMKIGQVIYQDFNWYHKGYLDEISLWNKALTPANIGAIMANNGEIADPMSETNLKLYYKCNQGIGYGNNTGLTSLTDALGLHNGTLLNFTLNGNASNWGTLDPLATPEFEHHSLMVYPNPAGDFLSVSGLAGWTPIRIVDVSGRLVFEKTISETETVNVSNLHSGVYFAVINNTDTVRFLKK